MHVQLAQMNQLGHGDPTMWNAIKEDINVPQSPDYKTVCITIGVYLYTGPQTFFHREYTH